MDKMSVGFPFGSGSCAIGVIGSGCGCGHKSSSQRPFSGIVAIFWPFAVELGANESSCRLAGHSRQSSLAGGAIFNSIPRASNLC